MKSLWGKDSRAGIGGSELAMLTLCEKWTKKDYEVRLYNDPYEQGVSEFEQLPISAFDPDENRDVLIVFRTPNYHVLGAKGMKVFLSFDQYTSKPFQPFLTMVDKVVGISEYHSRHFMSTYNFDEMIVIDLPLRVEDFRGIDVDKIPYRIIYSSVPDRGVMNLHAMWPLIQEELPEASLKITSDYRLWGLSHPNNQKYFMQWFGVGGVSFPPDAALPRRKYLEELCKADMLLYPHKAINPELFCVTMAESQYAGAYPVSSDVGALKTTNMGELLHGDAEDVNWRRRCVNKVVELLTDREELYRKQDEVIAKAFKRFHPDTVLDEWEKKVFK